MLKVIIFIVAFYLVMVGYVMCIADSKIFFPLRKIEATPQLIGLDFEDVYIDTKDNIKINGWFIPSKNAKYTILFYHGNGGNIGDRLGKVELFHAMGINVFIIDYRGYGRSESSPSERGTYMDAEASYSYLVNKRGIRPEEIILYGESLGGAVAVEVALKADIRALIVEGAFTSIRGIAREAYPFLSPFIISDKFDSLSKIGKITQPKLFIHSPTDEIVSFGLAKKLYDKAVRPKQMAEISGSHNSLFLDSREEYTSSIRKFIEDL